MEDNLILCWYKNFFFFYGLSRSYTTWTWHGEFKNIPMSQPEQSNVHFDNDLEDILKVGQETF